MLTPTIKLSVYQNGTLTTEPVTLTDIGLRETLLIASGYNEGRVNLICSKFNKNGRCAMTSKEGSSVYLIERIQAS